MYIYSLYIHVFPKKYKSIYEASHRNPQTSRTFGGTRAQAQALGVHYDPGSSRPLGLQKFLRAPPDASEYRHSGPFLPSWTSPRWTIVH